MRCHIMGLVTSVVNQVVYFSRGGAQAHHGERHPCRNRRRDRLPQTGQGSIEYIGRSCRQTQAWPACEGCFSCCSEGSEDQEAPQDERGRAGAHPASADQAVGRVERLQGKHEHHSRATAQGEEEACKGCLIGFCAECNQFRNRYKVLLLGNPAREPASSAPDSCGIVNQPETAWWTVAFSEPLRNPENVRDADF